MAIGSATISGIKAYVTPTIRGVGLAAGKGATGDQIIP